MKWKIWKCFKGLKLDFQTCFYTLARGHHDVCVILNSVCFCLTPITEVDEAKKCLSDQIQLKRLGPNKKSLIYEFLHSRFFYCCAAPKFVLARKPLVERQQLSAQSTFDTVGCKNGCSYIYGVGNIWSNE